MTLPPEHACSPTIPDNGTLPDAERSSLPNRDGASGTSRREFLKTSAGLSGAALLAPLWASRLHAAGTDTLRVGLIGCGGRGTGAAVNCADSAPGVKIHALGDLFEDRLLRSRRLLGQLGDRLDIADERCFTGFDAYQKVLATDVDLVILATPPGFRPIHIEAAVAAGKHIFAEKPVAVDPTGIRRVLAAADEIERRKLSFVAGTQRRHQESYLETIKRVHDGAIGEVVGGQVYWNQGGLWHHARRPEYSDMEAQIRNWLYYTWLSGDHIVEQHVHNIDVMNWAMGGPPLRAYGMGGRQSRTAPIYGHIFDHFAIEYEFEGGVRFQSFCRQVEGSDSRVGERLVGSAGTCDPNGVIRGANEYRYRNPDAADPYVQEHADLIAAIRSARPINEALRVAESVLTAIMGRMSAYTGKAVSWEQARDSKLDLVPRVWQFGELPEPPVAVPGRTPLT